VSSVPQVPGIRSPLLERFRQALALRHYSPRAVEAYVGWVRRYVIFHGRRPLSLGEQEVTAFLSHLATHFRVSASTQNRALAALSFLYSEVLGRELGKVPFGAPNLTSMPLEGEFKSLNLTSRSSFWRWRASNLTSDGKYEVSFSAAEAIDVRFEAYASPHLDTHGRLKAAGSPELARAAGDDLVR
jgi:hypothetical protein